MNDLLNNIESAIHSQVIERGEIENHFMYFEDEDLEIDGEVYVADFCVTTTTNDAPDLDEYKIDIVSVGIYVCDGVKQLYPEVEVFIPSNN